MHASISFATNVSLSSYIIKSCVPKQLLCPLGWAFLLLDASRGEQNNKYARTRYGKHYYYCRRTKNGRGKKEKTRSSVRSGRADAPTSYVHVVFADAPTQ